MILFLFFVGSVTDPINKLLYDSFSNLYTGFYVAGDFKREMLNVFITCLLSRSGRSDRPRCVRPPWPGGSRDTRRVESVDA